MNVSNTSAYSIIGIEDNHVLYSKNGDIALVYEMINPERYSVSEDQYDARISEFFTALYTMPKNTYVHKQDVYLLRPFDSSTITGNLYLDDALRKHFEAREGIKHYCVVAFVLSGLKGLEKSYQKNPFNYSKSLELEDRSNIKIFIDSVEKAVSIFNNVDRTRLVPLSSDDLKNHIYKYVSGFEDYGLYDIDFKEKKVGESFFDVFSFSMAEYFPDTVYNVRKNNEISNEHFTFYDGYMDLIGENIKYNHIYNQVIWFEGRKIIENQIELKRLEYSRLKSMSEQISKMCEDYDAYLQEVNAIGSDKILVKAHYNLIVFDKDKEILNEAKDKVKETLQSADINFYKPSKEVLKNLWLSSIVGRVSQLHKDHFFITHLKEALCFFTNTSVARSDEKGIYFNDRINQLPIKRDLWDEKNKRINARNGIIIASTGGGKSVVALNQISQLISSGVNVVAAEFGQSFYSLTQLYPEISTHFRYDSKEPLGINPFTLSKEGVTSEKISLLSEIVMKTWRVPKYISDAHVGVSMNKMIRRYYEKKQEKNETDYSYEDFYWFVVKGDTQLLNELDIQEAYFDLNSFKHICSEFTTGGHYENIFKKGGQLEKNIRDKLLVVFELTEIKKDPFLVTLILMILQDTIDTNILYDRGKKGALFFDEFAETQAMKDMYSTTEVLATVAILYQKIRKENGSIWIIIQDLSQLPDNEYTSGIIANTQNIIVLKSGRLATYDLIAEKFTLTKHDRNMMYSLRKNLDSQMPYSEQFIKIGDESFVTKLELSKAAFYTFQTQGEIWKKLQESYEKTKDMKESINQIIKES